MNQDTILYTLPQWFVFAGIIASIYGWVEKKKMFRMIGPVIFMLLGLYAGFAIANGYFSAYDYLTPAEIMNEELEVETFEELPLQAKMLPAYWIFIVSGIVAIPAFIFEWKEKKLRNLFIILTGLTALFGFFIIVGELRSL
ncbi:hypothetical protein SAMN05444280_10294 [Tangfeifania diversioriginum]|uniref:Uncharacterized protein n=1 Tax=Tangfeifania diversioriginum TaxID=1168035 RepID=A0A1M6B678_9BACT|nr:hypothetical protein [Tangfeifania diversioriginum]SHI43983.1 hypothetical protein SAMN05444280_10294 [Tangfeifania diversioriginum]